MGHSRFKDLCSRINCTEPHDDDVQCGTCQFYEAVGGPAVSDVYDVKSPLVVASYAYGVCHRFPPVPSERINKHHEDLMEIIGRWPMVYSEAWCGEWKAASANE